jgi:hypothetical protein
MDGGGIEAGVKELVDANHKGHIFTFRVASANGNKFLATP